MFDQSGMDAVVVRTLDGRSFIVNFEYGSLRSLRTVVAERLDANMNDIELISFGRRMVSDGQVEDLKSATNIHVVFRRSEENIF